MIKILDDIKGLLLLLSTLVMSTVFLLTKNGDYKNFYPYFPFNRDVVLTRDTYFYFLFEHLILVVMALFIYFESHRYKDALKVFVMIQIVDTLDYVLTYSATWEVLGFPLSWDILKVTIFALSIVNEILLQTERHLQNRI